MRLRPLVSVMIPCFNLGVYLEEAVESVLSQTVSDLEVLIVDDGSTDQETSRLLASARWPRTQVFRTKNHGLARARNLLLAKAQGEFVCALDADDKLHPAYLESALAAITRDPELTFVSSRLQMFGEESRVTPDALRCDLPTLLLDCPIFCAALTRRAAIVAIGGYDEHMPAQGDEDWDLWISLLESGHRGLILPEILFYYRRRAGSMCDQCTRADTHLRLLGYLTRKHEASYRAHIACVLAAKDRRIARQRQVSAAVDRSAEWLPPSLERLRAELARLRQQLPAHQAVSTDAPDAEQSARTSNGHPAIELTEIRAEYQRSVREAEALRTSVSWRLTGPLRKSYDLVRRFSPRNGN